MKITSISFKETNLFPRLMLDYISGNDSVKEFYKYAPLSEEIDRVIKDKIQLVPTETENIDRRLLVETIRKQYSGIEISELVSENISSLENSITFCVVTAHQLNIFGGPLYYIYKIAQAVSTCDQLKQQYQNYNFVPVYWMGSEDHDFEEINHISLFNRKIEWTDKQGGATGDYSTQTLLPLIEEIKNMIGNSDHGKELIQIFENAYALPTLTQAARYLVNALFGEYGLVIIDGNDKVFKQQFSEIMEDELLNQNSFNLVNEQIKRLESKGYKEQAFPREINLFYLSKNSRERIEYNRESSQYVVLNTHYKFSKEEIQEELKNYPERFSPNVILRPLFQQKILPSLAYIGGAGELSYWLQLKPVFEQYNVNFPQILLRNSALIISENVSRKIEKIGFNAVDFFRSADQLVKEFMSKNSESDLDVSAYKKNIEAEFLKLQEMVKNIDPTLVNVVGAELQKSLQSIDSIQKRIIKSLKQKSETELTQIEKIKTQLFPDHSLQERVENISSWYAAYGPAFIRELIIHFDVYNSQFLLLQE